MKSKESIAQNLTRAVVQAIVRSEYLGWPPDTPWGSYQPYRPEKSQPQPQDKK